MKLPRDLTGNQLVKTLEFLDRDELLKRLF